MPVDTARVIHVPGCICDQRTQEQLDQADVCDDPRGYEGIADEAGLRGRDRMLLLMMARGVEGSGAAATAAALDGPDPAVRASLTEDQRRFLDVLAERLMEDDGRAPGAAWIGSRLDWRPERVESVAVELRELGMISKGTD